MTAILALLSERRSSVNSVSRTKDGGHFDVKFLCCVCAPCYKKKLHIGCSSKPRPLLFEASLPINKRHSTSPLLSSLEEFIHGICLQHDGLNFAARNCTLRSIEITHHGPLQASASTTSWRSSFYQQEALNKPFVEFIEGVHPWDLSSKRWIEFRKIISSRAID